MILSSFLAAIGQLGDARFRKVLILGVGLTIALLVGATAGFLWLLDGIIPEGVTLFGREITALDDFASWAAIGLMLLLSVFLMVPVASAITSMFLDDVAQAVEDKHYPQLPPATPVPFGDAVRDTVNFLGVLILANIVALILGLIFLPAWLFIFWGVNGFLLGREYYTLAAIRRVGRAEAKRLRSRNMGTIWLAGILMAMPLSVPLVNLVIPILGAATFTHLVHRLQARVPSG